MMSDWILNGRRNEFADRFIVKGPITGGEIWEEYGGLFPDDAEAILLNAEFQPQESIKWSTVKLLSLVSNQAMALPGNPLGIGPLLYIMGRLLGPNGCPWDRQQTPITLLRYLLDESYEAAEALISNDHDALKDELGDVLLQVAFQSTLMDSSFFDIVRMQVQKLIVRHPHVFASHEILDAERVQDQWESQKQNEHTPRIRTSPWIYPALVMAKRQAKKKRIPDTEIFQRVVHLLQVYLEGNPGILTESLADAAFAVAEVGRQRHQDIEWLLWERIIRLDQSLENEI